MRHFALLLPFLVASFSPAQAQDVKIRDRWVYLQTNLQVDEQADKAEALLKRASQAGYNGVLLADYKLSILDRVPARYFANAKRVREAARGLKMQFWTAVAPFGYSAGMLAHDPNLAEGLPVREAPFVVKNLQGVPDPEEAPVLLNGAMEEWNGDKARGWRSQDGPGAWTFRDTTEKREGQSSLRMENIGVGNPPSGNSRVIQEVALGPWRQYRLSVWVKTRDFETPGSTRATVIADGKMLSRIEWPIQKTQDWTQYFLTFNSQSASKANLYLGVWGGKGGAIWWDDARLEDAGMLNILRRDGFPLRVVGADGTVFGEGRDFKTVADPKMGRVPWIGEYDWSYAPQVLEVSPGSRIKEGQKLKVSFGHVQGVYQNQVAACLSEPRVFDLLRDQIQRVQKALAPDGLFLSHDEIRVANWCETCRKTARTPGELLAANFRQCVAIAREESPRAKLAVWSDMFDPAHNAHDDYYLVNGSWAGSWEGVPKDVAIANWNSGKQKESLAWFDGRGHEQILAGYYDGQANSIKPWLGEAEKFKGVRGVMYTTWSSRYDDLEAFAIAAWGAP